MFHERVRGRYDVALCMYHDQALIPLKTLHFDEGVNMTLGLPIVRTSPDHGTAFDIAGKGEANPGAMIAAIEVAATSAENTLSYCCPSACAADCVATSIKGTHRPARAAPHQGAGGSGREYGRERGGLNGY